MNILKLIEQNGAVPLNRQRAFHQPQCPFCGHAYASHQERRPAITCAYCEGRGDKAEQLEKALHEILRTLVDKRHYDVYEKLLPALTDGYFTFELRVRLKKQFPNSPLAQGKE